MISNGRAAQPIEQGGEQPFAVGAMRGVPKETDGTRQAKLRTLDRRTPHALPPARAGAEPLRRGIPVLARDLLIRDCPALAGDV